VVSPIVTVTAVPGTVAVESRVVSGERVTVDVLSRVETDSRVPEPEQAVRPSASRAAAAVRIRMALAVVDRTGYFLRVGARPTRSGMVWA